MGETVIPVGKHAGDLKRIRGGGDAVSAFGDYSEQTVESGRQFGDRAAVEV